MAMSHKTSNPLKLRRLWWTDPGVITILCSYVVIGGLIIYWISLQPDFMIGAELLAVFLIIMFPVLAMFAKRTVSDSRATVDKKVVDRTRTEIEDNRRQVRKEFLETEIATLQRGEATPVLDVWRLDPSLEKRHPYFSALDTVFLDPSSHELWIRVELGELHWVPDEAKKNKSVLFQGIADFLSVISKDGYIRLLNKFFERIVLELYALRENEDREVPYPVFSLVLEKNLLAKIAAMQHLSWMDVEKAGECRFADGNDVEAHRSIPVPTGHGK